MNTASHIAASLFCWRKETKKTAVFAIVFGAMLPDLMMFYFYGYQKFIANRTESEMWSTLYFDPSWQLSFDVFNSIPVTLLFLLIAKKFGWRFIYILSGSALLHMCFDLPLHHDDGHRHFLPFSHWRFASPISYWDPQHFGHIITFIEVAVSAAIFIFIWKKNRSKPMRIVTFLAFCVYVVGFVPLVAYYLAH